MYLPLFLLVIGFLALFSEFFIPAGGIIGLCGFVSMIVGIVMGYNVYGSVYGSIILIITLTATPILIVVGFKFFPHTIFGKLIILKNTQDKNKGYVSYNQGKYQNLMGKEGISTTVLRPSGLINIENTRYNVITAGEYVEKGKKVKIIKVEGIKLVVKSI